MRKPFSWTFALPPNLHIRNVAAFIRQSWKSDESSLFRLFRLLKLGNAAKSEKQKKMTSRFPELAQSTTPIPKHLAPLLDSLLDHKAFTPDALCDTRIKPFARKKLLQQKPFAAKSFCTKPFAFDTQKLSTHRRTIASFCH